MQSKEWSVADIPDQSGKVVIVTGTGGLGYETALELAKKGAEVTLAGRNAEKGAESISKIKAAFPNAKVIFASLDLADLKSVQDFSTKFSTAHKQLDILINNAGVMTPKQRGETKDGFELQFGTNYLGHFALTMHLLPLLKATPKARVVNLSSIAHRAAKIHFDDLNWKQSYRNFPSYGQSKIAMLMFSIELEKQSEDKKWGFTAYAAHPGYARTDLIANGPGLDNLLGKMNVLFQPWISQSAADGALPTLFAATSPDAKPGGYYGPNGIFELKGPVGPAVISKAARDQAAQAKLWSVSEKMTEARPN